MSKKKVKDVVRFRQEKGFPVKGKLLNSLYNRGGARIVL
jgi:hypothetical protein